MKPSLKKILVVDDNAGIRNALKILLPARFGQVDTLASPKGLVSAIGSLRPDVVLLDMNFTADINTGNEGLFWLQEIKARYPQLPVVLFTAYADIQLAVEGMKRGAADFVVKPWDNNQLLETLTNAMGKAQGAEKTDAPTARPTNMFWGTSAAMQELRRNVQKIASTAASVLITGENGTGKDLLAAEVHALSSRAGQGMVSVDAGAIAETLFESELFGHVKGAFTDAKTDHAGKFEQANGSTLFLDEIGNIPLTLQAKLLRVLQNRCVTRVGDTKSRPVDIRLICATNNNLPQMVAEGRFREDLFYRLNTIHLELPPLRQRRDDIVPLAQMFLSEFAQMYGRQATHFSPKAEQQLLSCQWPGNIRQLRNVVEKAVILADSAAIDSLDIISEQPSAAPLSEPSTLESVEAATIRDAMARYGGNITTVAKALNISRPTLYAKLRKYDI